MADAQPRRGSREDLLDALTRHIQICAEIADTPGRLACYDKLQTQVGDVQPATPQPTPLRPGQPPATAGGTVGGVTPLTPPPLNVPGGGVATLGGSGGQVQTGTLAPPTALGQPGAAPPPAAGQPSDPDRAFDPRGATSTYRPPEGTMPKPQPAVRRTGARPVPNYTTPQPLVTLAASNLTYGESRYWQVTITITSNTPRALDTQVGCTFMNAGRAVGEAYFGPTTIAAGEQITTDLIGPSTTAYVDSTRCNVLSP
jgi:hypothetical protein